jgi:nitrate reductase NapAB chaperone NapD
LQLDALQGVLAVQLVFSQKLDSAMTQLEVGTPQFEIEPCSK